MSDPENVLLSPIYQMIQGLGDEATTRTRGVIKAAYRSCIRFGENYDSHMIRSYIMEPLKESLTSKGVPEETINQIVNQLVAIHTSSKANDPSHSR
jgi:hypothetical protein